MKSSLIIMGLLMCGGLAAAINWQLLPHVPHEGPGVGCGLHQGEKAAALFAALPEAVPNEDDPWPTRVYPPHAAQAKLELSNGDQHVISISCAQAMTRAIITSCRFDVGSEIKEGIAIVEPIYLLTLVSGGGI